MRLHLESTGNMQVWMNGRLLGRYFADGPQKDFYLPSGWLNFGGKNSVVLVLRPNGNGSTWPAITSAYSAPYEDYLVQKHTMRIRFK